MRTGIISTQAREKLLGILTGPPILAFVPALSLASFWLGGEVALATVALGIPLIFAGAGAFGFWSPQANHQIGLYKQVMPKAQFQKQLEFLFNSAITTGTNSVCIAFAIDNISEISEHYGQATAEVIWSRCRERAMSIIRGRDISAQIDNNCFATALRPSPHLDLEASISLAGRLQAAIEEPVQVRGASIFASCSIGFCVTDRRARASCSAWLRPRSGLWNWKADAVGKDYRLDQTASKETGSCTQDRASNRLKNSYSRSDGPEPAKLGRICLTFGAALC